MSVLTRDVKAEDETQRTLCDVEVTCLYIKELRGLLVTPRG